jgi:phosphate transport system permease protein
VKKNHISRRNLTEAFFQGLMLLAFGLVAGSLGFILITIFVKGLPALSWAMISQTPKGGYYLGKEGGILNAIVGSLDLAAGATLLALVFSLPLALSLHIYAGRSRWAGAVRLALDVLWGVPSIVYGAFGFALMLAMGLRSSLLGGIIALALLELPILTRAIDEIVQMIPTDLLQASYALGANRFETALHVITRQVLPGILTAVLLAFGRGIGDAASVLFTAGYTDRLPTSLLRPVASLPLAIFFQLGTPYPEVQARAYASALILTLIVLVISLSARWLARKLSKFTVK